MTNSDQHLIAIYRSAYNFLKEKVDEKVIRKQLDYYKNIKPKSLRHVFLQMISTLKNKQGYVNFIADPAEMKVILYNYNPVQINIVFKGDWKKLFKKFKSKFGKNYKMKINDNRNSWVMYSKGVLSCAKFLSNFKNAKDFDKFVKSFSH